MITLEKISHQNIHAVLNLNVSSSQKSVYPRSNGYSIAEGLYPADDDPVWMRAICVDERPIGFMMTSEAPAQGAYFLWRMMIDQKFQGCGHGAAAIGALITRIQRTTDPRVLILSHLEDNMAAGQFFSKLGFSYTGNTMAGNELEMELRFSG